MNRFGNKAVRELINIELLNNFIVSKQFKPLNSSLSKKTKINIENNKKFLAIIQDISALYKVKIDIIRVDEDEKSNDCYVGGEYCFVTKTISLRLSKNGMPRLTAVLCTFCHELAHHLQSKLFKRKKLPSKLFDILLYERAADILGYDLYSAHFKEWGLLSERSFRSYETESDIKWLIQYRNGTLKNFDYSL